MPEITRTLQIGFTPCSTGFHRICWWPVGDPGAITCEPAEIFGTAGVVAAYDLEVTFDDCEGIDVQGYVQPTCVPILDPTLQLAWGPADILPDEGDCAVYRVMCVESTLLDPFDIVDAGTGYLVGDALVFTGGGGAGAAAEVDGIGGSGEITSIDITDVGSGYTSAPTITVTTAAGINADIVCTLAPCPLTAYEGCDGTLPPGDAQVYVGEEFIQCSEILPVVPDYTVELYDVGPCRCYTCVTVTITNDDVVPVDVFYTECTTMTAVLVSVPGLATEQIGTTCEVISGTIVVMNDPSLHTITETPCP